MSENRGYAVYDKTLARFVTGVHSTAAKAEEAANVVEGHDYETRKV